MTSIDATPAPRLSKAQKVTAGLALFVASFGWGLAPVFIRYLSHDYDPYSQTFLRYGSGTLALCAVCLIGFRAEFVRLLREPKLIVPLALVTVLHQQTWTHGTYGSTATISQLTVKLSVPLIIAFSFLMFHDERSVIRSPLYVAGTIFSLIGVAGVLAKDAHSLIPNLDRSSILLLLTALFWAVYVVWAKHLVADIHPVPLFTVMAIWTTLGFLLLTLAFGDPQSLAAAGPRTTAIAVFSGLLAIALAHPCYHYAQRHLGAALCGSLNLVNPLFTYAIALFLWPDERLLPTQWAGAGLLLFGTVLVTQVKKG